MSLGGFPRFGFGGFGLGTFFFKFQWDQGLWRWGYGFELIQIYFGTREFGFTVDNCLRFEVCDLDKILLFQDSFFDWWGLNGIDFDFGFAGDGAGLLFDEPSDRAVDCCVEILGVSIFVRLFGFKNFLCRRYLAASLWRLYLRWNFL